MSAQHEIIEKRGDFDIFGSLKPGSGSLFYRKETIFQESRITIETRNRDPMLPAEFKSLHPGQLVTTPKHPFDPASIMHMESTGNIPLGFIHRQPAFRTDIAMLQRPFSQLQSENQPQKQQDLNPAKACSNEPKILSGKTKSSYQNKQLTPSLGPGTAGSVRSGAWSNLSKSLESIL